MIQVLIERRIADGMLSTYEENSRLVLRQSFSAEGFISGEAFSDINNPNHRFVLCKWRSSIDWNRWTTSDERLELMNLIAPILTEPEKVTLLKN